MKITKRKYNVFKISKKKLEYTELIKTAVLDRRITGLRLVMNGGYDYVDTTHKFLLLLIQRGQVASIESYQDLLACDDYLRALLACPRFVSVKLECRHNTAHKGSFASLKRIEKAQDKLFKATQTKYSEAV